MFLDKLSPYIMAESDLTTHKLQSPRWQGGCATRANDNIVT
jgi:hypothetical protein